MEKNIRGYYLKKDIHFIIIYNSKNSLAALIHDSEDKITDYANWYFVYVLELVIRVNFF